MNYVLLALAEEPAHGIGIQQQIIGDTVGEYVPLTSIYRELANLERKGMVTSRPAPRGHQRVYAITPKGRMRLQHEAQALRGVLSLAMRRTGMF